MLRFGGRYCLVGNIVPGAEGDIVPHDSSAPRARSWAWSATRPGRSRARSTSCCGTRETYPFDKLVSHRYTLDEINRAFEESDWAPVAGQGHPRRRRAVNRRRRSAASSPAPTSPVGRRAQTSADPHRSVRRATTGPNVSANTPSPIGSRMTTYEMPNRSRRASSVSTIRSTLPPASPARRAPRRCPAVDRRAAAPSRG